MHPEKKPAPAGGATELLRLALPLILSSSFMTLQITIDRILLSQASSDAVAASMPAALLYWTIFSLLQNTANYATTFVAQYTGAGRPERVGPAVWQAFYFSLVSGIAFMGLVFVARPLFALGGHAEAIQELELTYFHYLCFAALPATIVAAANSFFAGRGDSWTVLLVDATGLAINTVLVFALVPGRWGLPRMGIAGAGLATIVGTSSSAILALVLFFRPRHEALYKTLSGWRFDPELFRRLMRFGLPNGLQWLVEGLAFTVFLFLVGRLGPVDLAATSITFSINMVAVLPMFGVGQAVMILVGQRLGEDNPELAERSTWTGYKLAWLYMGTVAVSYALAPRVFMHMFENGDAEWPKVAALIPELLRFVAVYSLFDSMNIIFTFALRGAGDTRFVTAVAIGLAWPIMVAPTWAVWYFNLGLYWAWTAGAAYVISQAIVFMLRFRHGRWKSMRVIETRPEPCIEEVLPAAVNV